MRALAGARSRPSPGGMARYVEVGSVHRRRRVARRTLVEPAQHGPCSVYRTRSVLDNQRERERI